MNQLLESFYSLLFPSVCLCCRGELEIGYKQLCLTCQSQIELIDPNTRCPLCFLEQCDCSKKKAVSYNHLGSCFDYIGPQKSLLTAFKYHNCPYLASSLSAFMLLQFERLGWATPDIITYIPQPFLRMCERGYNQSALLAESFGKLIDRPVLPLLKRTGWRARQTLLSKQERQKLASTSFSCRNEPPIKGKRLLLIDDVITTGATVECASRQLSARYPLEVNVLSLIRTEPPLAN